MSGPQSKQDVDRIKHRVGARKAALSRVKFILETYRQGRAASACMDEIEKAMESVK